MDNWKKDKEREESGHKTPQIPGLKQTCDNKDLETYQSLVLQFTRDYDTYDFGINNVLYQRIK